MQLAKISLIQSRLCLKALSLWNGGFLVQLFISLPRACQDLLAPVQCHLQAYVGRTPRVHQMHARFERPNSWSSPRRWKHEGCSCGNDPVDVSDLSAMRKCLLWWALSREGLVGRQGSAGECRQEPWVCCRPARLRAHPYWKCRSAVQEHLGIPAQGTGVFFFIHINFPWFFPILQHTENFLYE